jgi:hypothetical protein
VLFESGCSRKAVPRYVDYIMKIIRLSLLTALMLGALLHQSDGQQVLPLTQQLKLAGVMPKGALLYIQARDLSALMKKWLASPVRKDFYGSPSFDAFSRSHLYVKLQNRKADFDQALGFSIGEDRLAELAGGASALSVYDIGKLELVFVTEIPSVKAVQSTMFKAAPQFEQKSASGVPYYLHEVTTDGGRLNQQFCFAYSGGKLIVATTEGLMVRALTAATAGSKESLLSDVMATGTPAAGFSAHDVTLWLDQGKLNKNRHFINYWIYHNTADNEDNSISNIESGLIDLEFASDGMRERRWFVLKTGDGPQPAGKSGISAEDTSALLRFAPPGVGMAEVKGPLRSNQDLGEAASRVLFGKLPDESATGTGTPNTADSTPEASEDHRSERYSQLDERFDMDVDDDSGAQVPATAVPSSSSAARATAPGAAGGATDPAKRFGKNIASLLDSISPAGSCEMVRATTTGLDTKKPFVGFERAVVIEMKVDAILDRTLLERTIADESRSRFVIAGVDSPVVWQDEAAVRYMAQSLLEQGACYCVSGKYLVLASSKEFAKDILRAAATTTTPPATAATKLTGSVELYAVLHIADAQPVFDRLMAKLDRGAAQGEGDNTGAANGDSNSDDSKEDASKEGDQKKEVKFFSDNLSSLIKASGIREVRLQREISGSVMAEQVSYSWK